MDDGDVTAIEKELHRIGVLSEQQLDKAFTYAIRNCSAGTVGILLKHGARLKRTGMSRFELRMRGDPAIFQKLIDNGLEINSTEYGAPWIWVAIHDNEQLLHWFLDHGADPNMTNRSLPNWVNNDIITPLAYAAEAPEKFGLKILLSRGANMDEEAIFRAIAARSHLKKNNVPHIRILLDHGADVNQRSRRWGTPLQHAIWKGRADMVEFLLERGADPTIATVRGTPAEHARNTGRMDIHDLIMKAIQDGRST
ncbi:ankyrin [Karstenula rhodostoma CBS 690.94]|uniref:Ankyrin n=1 Tax=Karstenula rhodostoma CBS 690.94 TaxID=1392251 RepID=A0A9P4UHE9_9PLEO|nr:ankyrin [Karstenula rhodostoma CBS 690.94]